MTAIGTTRIFLVDDHEVVRRGVGELLSMQPDFDVVGEASSAAEALGRIAEVRPDVVIVDGRLHDGSGIEICREIRSQLPDTYCMILTSFDDTEAILSAVVAGASGYVLKDVQAETLVDDVRQVARGYMLISPQVVATVMERARAGGVDGRVADLTPRERDVLDLIADGLTNRQIAHRLSLSEKTVKNYINGLFAKLGVQRRTQAAALASEFRLN